MDNVFIKKEELSDWIAQYFKHDLISIDDMLNVIEDLNSEIDILNEEIDKLRNDDE